MARWTVIFVALVSWVSALPVADEYGRSSVSIAQSNSTSYTLLYQNNLNTTDDVNHISFILLDPLSHSDGVKSCASIGEALLSNITIQAHLNDITHSLQYARLSNGQVPGYWTKEGAVGFGGNGQLRHISTNGSAQLQALCTNSFQDNNLSLGSAQPSARIVNVTAGSNQFMGYRNQKSFRFLGIPYADTPARWQHSQPYSGTRQTLGAYSYGAQCWQPGGNATVDNENCLFLNIQTPYLPTPGSKSNLRKVQFYIHGGAFMGGTGSDPTLDGSNVVSREDVVTVTMNYRLGTLGFLAIPGTSVSGNFGIADQVNALNWVIANIAAFGGDPTRITIAGGSAGAASVRALLSSPAASGKFQAAIAGSNLGGGDALGMGSDSGTTFSSYLTVDESYSIVGQQIFQEAGCTQSNLNDQIACLKTIPASTILSLSTAARFVVQDGVYVNTEELLLSTKNGSTAFVDVIMGNARNDGASYSNYPHTPVTSVLQGIQEGLGISQSAAQSVIDSGLFPLYNSGNLTLDAFNISQRIATDKTFRCVDQASAYAGATNSIFKSTWYYQLMRGEGGYDPNNVGTPATSPAYPCGDPNQPYFAVHASDTPWFFGGMKCIRDADDLVSMQASLAHLGAFLRSGNPNPTKEYLMARGYDDVSEMFARSGPWEQVSSPTGPIRFIDAPVSNAQFVDTAQCAFLGYPIDYYVKGGR